VIPAVRFLPDVNVWLALVLSGHPHHTLASRWLDGVTNEQEVCFCRMTQQSTLRLLTTAAVFAPLGDPPLSNLAAWAVVDALLGDLRVSLRTVEPAGLAAAWRAYSALSSPSPKVWVDSYLAAFARVADATLVSTDADFQAYPDLDPLLLTKLRG
jgi:toxin-antitoxin system PIN domain toxin